MSAQPHATRHPDPSSFRFWVPEAIWHKVEWGRWVFFGRSCFGPGLELEVQVGCINVSTRSAPNILIPLTLSLLPFPAQGDTFPNAPPPQKGVPMSGMHTGVPTSQASTQHPFLGSGPAAPLWFASTLFLQILCCLSWGPPLAAHKDTTAPKPKPCTGPAQNRCQLMSKETQVPASMRSEIPAEPASHFLT